jgi:hypothetical protein
MRGRFQRIFWQSLDQLMPDGPAGFSDGRGTALADRERELP